MGEESSEIWVIGPAPGGSLVGGRGRDPFEEKDQCMERLQGGQRVCIKRIQVVDDKRKSERLEELTIKRW